MLEFKAGRLEQGRTMLNSIIQTNPKRGDIVSILIDMEIKYGKKQSVRLLLDKLL
jgi:hypothetical protein